MKITYVANIRVPSDKGHVRQILKMCEVFGRLEADVTLVVPERKDSQGDTFEHYKLEKTFKIKRVKIFEFFRAFLFLGRFGIYLEYLHLITKLLFLKIDKDSIIYTRNSLVLWLFSLRGYKTAYERHEWFSERKKFLLLFLRRANHIITTNNFIRKKFQEDNFFKTKEILVAPNGVNLKIFDIDTERDEAIRKLNLDIEIKDKIVLVYTGSFKTKGEEKGISDILSALAIILKENKDIIFIAAGGDEKDVEYYQVMAKEKGVDSHVYLFKRQSQDALALFQRMSDVLLMPFPRIAHYEYFMTPLKMFEYMAGKRPIIASDLPSIREVLNDDNCIFCAPGDAHDLSKKIMHLIQSPDLGRELSSKAYRDVARFTWDERGKNILKFIKMKND